MNQYEHIDELIAKHLAAETSAAEDDIIKHWLTRSETNRIYYSEMKLVYEASEEKTVRNKINIDIAWDTFSKKIQEPEKKKPVIKKLTAAFYGKAAIFICALGLGYFIYSQLHTEEQQIVFSSTDSTTRNNTLPDKSFVSLYPKSSINYSSSFNKTNRELNLSGEAYFHVQHNAELPFIINTGTVFIKDVGTTFIVKANPSDSIVTVHVTDGEVIFYSARNTGISLTKNETGIYNSISATFRKKENHSVHTGSEIHQTLSFENTSLRFVIDTLNKVYHEHIILSCEKLESLELTAAFQEKTAMPIVETIAETFGLSVTRTNGTVLLNGHACKE